MTAASVVGEMVVETVGAGSRQLSIWTIAFAEDEILDM